MDKIKNTTEIEKLSDTLHVSLDAFLAIQELRCNLGLTRKEIASYLIIEAAKIPEIVGGLHEKE